MDFKYNGKVYYQMQDVIDAISADLAYWNNFEAEQPKVLEVKKVPAEGETLGLHVKEVNKIKDIFGRA